MSSDSPPAQYKIEVHFGPKRTTAGPNVCGISFFESGRRLNGDGDEMMYVRKQRDSGLALNAPGFKDKKVKRGSGGCGAFIPGSCLRSGIAKCPKCGAIINAEQLTSTLLANLTTDTLSRKLADWFRKLDSNADIYLKFHPTDIRYQAMAEADGLDRARSLRGLTIYPLNNIIRDTSAGASLEGRFKALLSC